MSTDTSEIVATYTDDGTEYEVDHLGINYPEQWGEFAIYSGGTQVTIFEIQLEQGTPIPPEPLLVAYAKHAIAADAQEAEGLEYPAVGALVPWDLNAGRPGFVVGECRHAVAGSEWRAGFRNCERCARVGR